MQIFVPMVLYHNVEQKCFLSIRKNWLETFKTNEFYSSFSLDCACQAFKIALSRPLFHEHDRSFLLRSFRCHLRNLGRLDICFQVGPYRVCNLLRSSLIFQIKLGGKQSAASDRTALPELDLHRLPSFHLAVFFGNEEISFVNTVCVEMLKQEMEAKWKISSELTWLQKHTCWDRRFVNLYCSTV